LSALRVAAAALAVALPGCGGSTDAESGELTVSAASSLTEAFDDYGATLAPTDVQLSFAGSDELAAQIRQGAEPDVFAAANTALPDALFDEGLVDEPTVFARNSLVLAVPAAAEIESIEDLTEPGLDIVIGAEAVPVGSYTLDVFDRLDASGREAILANVRSEESDVKGIVGKLTQGAADAGFVYRSDVVATGSELRAIELARELQPDVAYGIAVVRSSDDPESAQRFIDGLLEGEGARVLESSGFEPPPDE